MLTRRNRPFLCRSRERAEAPQGGASAFALSCPGSVPGIETPGCQPPGHLCGSRSALLRPRPLGQSPDRSWALLHGGHQACASTSASSSSSLSTAGNREPGLALLPRCEHPSRPLRFVPRTPRPLPGDAPLVWGGFPGPFGYVGQQPRVELGRPWGSHLVRQLPEGASPPPTPLSLLS